jgi:D-alanyl-D-alanine carboxypeptidase
MKAANFFIPILSLFIGLTITSIINTPKLIDLISPQTNGKILGINQWFPKTTVAAKENSPEITAQGAIFLDAKNGEILYSKQEHKRLPIASLVKVMTVLLALENKSMDNKYLVSKRASEMEPDKMLLIAGEKLSLKDLLYGIFLVSANDAAEVIAEGTFDDRDKFIKLMNEKANQLGMKDTYYVNPTGLDEDSGNSYSSAYDLAVLTRFLIRNFSEVVDISKTEHIVLPKTNTHQDYDMYSGINLLSTYPGVVGFKTGFTPEAGYTLITLVRKEDREIIGVLLGSQYRRDEARELLDFSFGID